MATKSPQRFRYGPYHRLQSRHDNDLMESTGKVGGRAARNVYAGSIPMVKAFDGPLPDGKNGIEFYASVKPDPGGAPGRPTWSRGRPDVEVLDDEMVAIPVRITKRKP